MGQQGSAPGHYYDCLQLTSPGRGLGTGSHLYLGQWAKHRPLTCRPNKSVLQQFSANKVETFEPQGDHVVGSGYHDTCQRWCRQSEGGGRAGATKRRGGGHLCFGQWVSTFNLFLPPAAILDDQSLCGRGERLALALARENINSLMEGSSQARVEVDVYELQKDSQYSTTDTSESQFVPAVAAGCVFNFLLTY